MIVRSIYHYHHHYIITIIIRLKQCNTQLLGIAFGVTSHFLDTHSDASSNSVTQPYSFRISASNPKIVAQSRQG